MENPPHQQATAREKDLRIPNMPLRQELDALWGRSKKNSNRYRMLWEHVRGKDLQLDVVMEYLDGAQRISHGRFLNFSKTVVDGLPEWKNGD